MKPTSEAIDELTLAEASAWLTRLQDSGRTVFAEAAFKEWLAASPAHARAFTRVNDVWEIIPGAAALVQPPRTMRYRRAHRARTPWLAAAACAALVLVAVGVVRTLAPAARTYQTALGVQKTVVLADHTRVTLNTDTKLLVEYRGNERHVVLERGEALFHVTENTQRPFIVQTGNAQVVDLGTVFDVRHYSPSIAVTLLEGKVWVGAQSAPSGQSALPTVLAPGERLILHADGTHVLDRPDIPQTLAWQQGKVYFDDTTLAEAVAELNRYGGVRIGIADPALATLRVSGVFSVRDPVQFAMAVASLHDLHADRVNGAVVLKH